MIADLDDGIGVIILINGNVQSYGAVGMAMNALSILRAGLRQQDIPIPPSAASLDSVADADDYVGTYNAGGDSLVVTAQGRTVDASMARPEHKSTATGGRQLLRRSPEVGAFPLGV